MKHFFLTLVFSFCAIALSAQEGFPVKYQGDKPTISDFAWAFLSAAYEDVEDNEEGMDESTNAFKEAWIRHRKGLPLDDHEALTIDQKNGFVIYESRYGESLMRIEMCFWNEADKKHRLIAYNISCFDGDRYSAGQYDGLRFFRYDNSSRRMAWVDAPGFEVEYTVEGGAWVSYDLPRTGKDITVNYWYDSDRKQKTLRWDGRKFNY